MDVVVHHASGDKWKTNIHRMIFQLRMAERGFFDNFYYVAKMITGTSFTVEDHAYLLLVDPIIQEPTVTIHRKIKDFKVSVQKDAYFSYEQILLKSQLATLNKYENKIGYKVTYEKQSATGGLFIVKPTGITIIVNWGPALFTKVEGMIITKDDKLVRSYIGESWLPDAYRVLQVKYNALIYYSCAEPMQMYQSVKIYLTAQKFPSGPLFLFRQFFPKQELLLKHVLPTNDRDIFTRKIIEDTMIVSPLRKFIIVGSTKDDLAAFLELYRFYSKRIRHLFLYNSFDDKKNNSKFDPFKNIVPDERWTLFKCKKDMEQEIKGINI